MQPYFVWKDIDSRVMGVWVSELPAPTRAAERVKQLSVPGRAGDLTIREGQDVHEGYVRECRVTVPADADFGALLEWLSGDGSVVFSNEPDRVYSAGITAAVKWTKEGNSLKTSTIPFYVHPHKGQCPPEGDISLEASGTVFNPGTVAARPLIALTFTGSCSVEVGGTEMTLEHTGSEDEETVVVDCDAELITQGGEIWEGVSNNQFPLIPPGTQDVTLTDCTALITPRWRWF